MNTELNKQQKLQVFAHELEVSHLEQPDHQYIDPILSTKLKPISIDKHLFDGEKILVGEEFEFLVIHTPGHTRGSLYLYENNKKILFSRDKAFLGGNFGRTDFPGSNSIEIIESLEKLTNLDIQILYAGHMPIESRNVSAQLQSSYRNAKYYLKNKVN
jgi:glyoxylase-like metal-dependent hydrolase (beta-lactamase superfamily II)